MSKDLLSSSQRENISAQSNNSLYNTPPPLPEQPYRENNAPAYSNVIPGGMNDINGQMNNLNIGGSQQFESQLPPRSYVVEQFPSRSYNTGQNSTNSYNSNQFPTRSYGSNAPPIPQPPSAMNTTSLLGSIDPHAPPPAYNDNMDTPQLPPRVPNVGNAQLPDRTTQNAEEERELQRNPTAFYDKSPVFDEDLYFKYGK